MIVVADASAVATFLLPDEAGLFADFARETFVANGIHVPRHWAVELASVIWKAQRRKRLTDEDASRIAVVATRIATATVVAGEASIGDIVAAAARWGLTPYDACYLLLAKALVAPILTADNALRRVAAQQGVTVLLP